MPFVMAECDPREISFFHHDRAFRFHDPPTPLPHRWIKAEPQRWRENLSNSWHLRCGVGDGVAMVVRSPLPRALKSVVAGLPDGCATTCVLVVGSQVPGRFM